MSDYLTNLAARTIASPSLKPRLRMRFEPEVAGEVATPVAETPIPPRSATVIEPMPPARREPPREGPLAPASPPHVEAGEPLVQPPPRRIREEHATHHARETTHVIEREHQREHELERERSERVERIETQRSEVVHEREKTILHRHEIAPPRVQTPRVAQSPASPPPPRPRGVTPVQPAKPSEPTIEISIGRIEVRAAPPAARTVAPAKRSVMTIDDYVARRKDRR